MTFKYYYYQRNTLCNKVPNQSCRSLGVIGSILEDIATNSGIQVSEEIGFFTNNISKGSFIVTKQNRIMAFLSNLHTGQESAIDT